MRHGLGAREARRERCAMTESQSAAHAKAAPARLLSLGLRARFYCSRALRTRRGRLAALGTHTTRGTQITIALSLDQKRSSSFANAMSMWRLYLA